MRGREHRERDRQVEARALLAQTGGREVDRDTAHGELELRGGDPAADSFLRLLAGAIGEPDDREGRAGQLEAGLDLDAAWLEPDKRVCDRPCEHAATLGGKA